MTGLLKQSGLEVFRPVIRKLRSLGSAESDAELEAVLKHIKVCTACSFWDTGLNPMPPWRRVEVASDGALPG
jgi:hypothetical protein